MPKSGIYHVQFDRNKLDICLKIYGLSKTELAELMDVQRRTLYLWLGSGTLPVDRYLQLLDLFGKLDKKVIENMGLNIGAKIV